MPYGAVSKVTKEPVMGRGGMAYPTALGHADAVTEGVGVMLIEVEMVGVFDPDNDVE